MARLLSICIPSLNRPALLRNAITSIRASKASMEKIEVCISNNCSEMDYAEVEAIIAEIGPSLNVSYVRQAARLPLDEHMHYVKTMAAGQFIYFLGDDDFFLDDQIDLLIEFIEQKDPDLAIFNGKLVDGTGSYLGAHFSFPPREYLGLTDAFADLRDRGMFGAVLVRAELLQDLDFRRLYGTSHAYGCFWLSLIRRHVAGVPVKIFVPEFPCVALRCAEKNYNHVLVYFRDIPYEFAVYKRFSEIDGLPLIADFERRQEKKTTSFRFFCALSDLGSDLDSIRKINSKVYDDHRFKILAAKYFSASKTYRAIKVLYRSLINRSRSSAKRLVVETDNG